MNHSPVSRALKLAAIAALTLGVAPLQAAPFYQLESALTIKSPSAPSWDYLTFDTSRDCVYIARRDDGILIYDAKAKKITGPIENSQGGNATVLVPEFDLGYVINQDGSTTTFKISTLKTMGRTKFGEDADNGFYDSVTKQILITQGDSGQATFLDAKTGAVTGVLKIDSSSLEGVAPDGEGNFFMALRDRDKVVKIDARTRTLAAEWKVVGHKLPNGIAYDTANKRVFVSTRGDNPALLVFDAATGKVVAEPTIGRGNDQVIFDAGAKRLYTANGFDGTIVILDQVDANTYKLVEAPTTRPYARTMALDPKTKTLYLTTAEGTVDVSKRVKTSVGPFYPNTYFKDTFVLLTYTRK